MKFHDTIRSYANCIRLWHQINFKGKFAYTIKSQIRHLADLLSPFRGPELPKAFKGMLADHFSLKLSQDRPEVLIGGENLFYPRYKHKILTFVDSKYSEDALLRVYWDLMQTKALAARVPESFIFEAYAKHAKTVSAVTQTDSKVLEEFKEFCRPFMKKAAETLDNFHSGIPSNHACSEAKRGEGGVRSQWETTNSPLLQPEAPRLDPTVYILSGEAGCGKSLLQVKLAQNLGKLIGKTYPETCYTRNSSTDHWDGYNRQPLTIVDDFLQQTCKQNEHITEALEFIQLASTCDYVLPQAELRDKGMKFSSPLICYSTNQCIDRCMGILLMQLRDERAVARRISYLIDKSSSGHWCLWEHVLVTSPGKKEGVKSKWHKIHSTNKLHHFAQYLSIHMKSQWEKKVEFYLNHVSEKRQTMRFGPDCFGYLSDSAKRDNTVSVHGIVEPLKVRTITVGTAENFFLKPLQKSLLSALKPYTQFKPCFTPDYQDQIDLLSQKEGYWLSGDYTSATDGLHQDLFHAGLSSLEEYLPENFWGLVKREMEPHFCVYPESSKVEPVWQTNGQLMGSLLSFPLLCLANAFTLSKTMSLPISQIPALFHGDDLLARVTPEQYQRWKDFCPTIGLSLSIGKNYFSSKWGSIDSQVFYETKKLGTGKFGALSSKALTSIPTLISRGVPKGLIVSLFKKELSLTPRSLDVSERYGGLAVDGKPETDLALRVFKRRILRRYQRRGSPDQGYTYTLHPDFGKHLNDNMTMEVPEEMEREDKFSDWKGINKITCQPSLYNFDSTLERVCVYRKCISPLLENLVKASREKFILEWHPDNF